MLVSVQDVSAKSYDYSIVGGGTAGLTLAVRLSEDSNVSVLVLEAGGANIDDPAILRPASYGSHLKNDDYDWNHRTTPQKYSGDVQYDWPRGKVLGGSSAINFMCWTRPPAAEIDDIERLGNPGWNWKNFKKYSDKLERFVEPTAEIAKKHELRTEGWMTSKVGSIIAAFPGTLYTPELEFQKSLLKFGIPYAKDPFGGDPKGPFLNPQTVDPVDSTRSYAVTILELSGIGKKSVLEKLNIPIQLDLPVGENVQEHMYIGVTFELRNEVDTLSLDALRDPKALEKHVELQKKNEGCFSMGLMGYSSMPLQAYSPRADEIHKAAKDKILANKDKYGPGVFEQMKVHVDRLDRRAPGCEYVNFPGFLSFPNPPKPGKKYFTMLVAMNHMFSRGTIHSTSKDPCADPEYDPQYFKEQIDLDTFVECVKFIQRLKDTAPFKDIIGAEINPGPKCTTDEQLQDWIKKYMSTTYHTSSSASMLPKDKGGVVDPKLKASRTSFVYGVENIRVCDLSILPIHFAAHPQASIYAFAEQAADVIKGKI
ncbi:hypothetical protein EWM64_g8416 [Hericium alpestre]|uniref:Glucose-methanol-choline oxidoreductase N-terminal domain-containing protein n=1 Tax=Hericium alpestre TaxID=135208 RepID=A0A4Y9ZL73_9AGAM|nr:hypothetical protein EWM64_g8416 [Hericium alpestre]